MENQPIVIEHVFNAPAAKIWCALTDKDEMKIWYFDLAEFRPEIGFEFEFTGGTDEGPKYVHHSEITEVMPQKKLTYSWSYAGYSGKSFVTFELFGQGDKTRLKLTHAGLETFPKENSDLAVQNFIEGWNHIIHISLKEYLEK